jgi:tetratricopeptide (TPR) repeat protein
MPRRFLTPVLLVLLMASAIGLQAMRERGGDLPIGGDSVLYLQSPATLQRLALSYDSIVADVYWIRAIQLYGDTRLGNTADSSYALLYPLLELTTTLDPYFDVAYQFGALYLAERPPGGPGRPDLAIKLLERGIQVQPEDWRLYQAVGFVHYWSTRDYAKAAEWFSRASHLPEAPNWMEALAAVTLAEGGNRKSSRLLWQQIQQTATDDWFLGEAQRRLKQLDAMDQIELLQKVVAAFTERNGRAPSGWTELARDGYVRGAVVDPNGEPYRLEGSTVALDPKSRLLPLPWEGQKLQ